MKKIVVLASVLTMLAACGNKENDYDATGTFEATETTVSAEQSGVLLAFNVNEGDNVEAGREIGMVDTTQIWLKIRQLGATKEVYASQKPDMEKQIAATRQQLLKARQEQRRYQELVNAYPESGSAVIASNSAWRQSIAAYADVLTQAHGLSALEAAKKINGVLVTRTVDLCYALHEAGESKLPESMITGKYHNLAGSTKSLSSAAQLTRTAGGRLRLTVTLSSDHAVIEKMLNKSLTASETAENKAAMLAVATSSYRTMISGQYAFSSNIFSTPRTWPSMRFKRFISFLCSSSLRILVR